MNVFRFSLASLLVSTLIASIFIAAIATGHIVFIVIVHYMLWTLLLGSVLGTIYRPRAEQRAFWCGFMVFGAGASIIANPMLGFGSDPIVILLESIEVEFADSYYYVGSPVSILMFAFAGALLAVKIRGGDNSGSE